MPEVNSRTQSSQPDGAAGDARPETSAALMSQDGRIKDVASLVERQRQFFQSGRTLSAEFRTAQLRKLKQAVKEAEPKLLAALKEDLNKSEFEAYTSEIGMVYEEINHALANVRSWMRPRRVSTPLVNQPSQSRIHPQPKGLVLVIGPWNYPCMLLLSPLVGAIAAGNCAILKPSEMAPATSRALVEMFAKTFSPEYCAIVPGGVPETTELLAQRFDHIFFTGSIQVGRVVMRAAAEHLTPVTLELGGKSPCIIDHDIDVEVTARRVLWGKFYNAGQTCVAPDYLLVHRKVKKDLLAAMKRCASEFFGENPQQSPDYGRIVNERHFDRLVGLLGQGQVVIGAKHERSSLYFSPTIIDDVKTDMRVMEEEIFGPILPVLDWEHLDDAFGVVRMHKNPLACYVFTRNEAVEKRVIDELPFGGGCVNNALVHLANPNLPFGGIGESGMGAYHGQDSFETFSHKKSISRAGFRPDLKLRYPPYDSDRLNLVRRFLMK